MIKSPPSTNQVMGSLTSKLTPQAGEGAQERACVSVAAEETVPPEEEVWAASGRVLRRCSSPPATNVAPSRLVALVSQAHRERLEETREDAAVFAHAAVIRRAQQLQCAAEPASNQGNSSR